MKDLYFTVIVCEKCKRGGGTLIKDDKGGYIHQRCSINKLISSEELAKLKVKS